VAITVLAKVPGRVPAVKRPALPMLPPAAADHTGEMATVFPPASLPTAVYCCVPPMDRVVGVGVTVMLANGPAITVTEAVPERLP
jgi:hypothetical protein